MVENIYRVGVKKGDKTVYHHFKNDEAVLVFLSTQLADAERITLSKRKRFSLDEEDC